VSRIATRTSSTAHRKDPRALERGQDHVWSWSKRIQEFKAKLNEESPCAFRDRSRRQLEVDRVRPPPVTGLGSPLREAPGGPSGPSRGRARTSGVLSPCGANSLRPPMHSAPAAILCMACCTAAGVLPPQTEETKPPVPLKGRIAPTTTGETGSSRVCLVLVGPQTET
jgi:hypothetical protein